MFKSSQKITALILCLALVGLIAACGNSNSTSSASKKSDNNSASGWNESASPVTLNFYTAYSTVDTDKRMFAPLLKALPKNIQINFLEAKYGSSALKEFYAAGTPIDIISCSAGAYAWTVEPYKAEADMTQYFKKYNIDLSRFQPSSIQAVKDLGGLYGLPYSIGGMTLYYNKDIFDKFGVAYPKDGMTWDQIPDLAKKMTRNVDGKQYLGFYADGHALLLNSYSVPFFDSKTNQATFDVNPLWKKIYQKIVLDPTNTNEFKDWASTQKNLDTGAADAFSKTQTLAMLVNLGGSTNWPNVNFGQVTLPVFSDKPDTGTQPYPSFILASKTSKHLDAVAEVMKVLTSDEVQTEMSANGDIMSPLLNKSIQNDFDKNKTSPQNADYADALFHNKFANPAPRTQYDGLMVGLKVDVTLQQVISGQADLNTYLRALQEALSKAIAQQNGS